VRYFVLHSSSAAPLLLARLDEDRVQVSVLAENGWQGANELIAEVVSDAEWEEIDLHAAAEVARELDLSLVT